MIKKTKIAFLFLFIYWLAFSLLIFLPRTIFPVPQTNAIQNVQYISDAADTPDTITNNNWQDIALPDSWYKKHHNIEQIWYQKDIDLNESITTDIWAIYLPSVAHNAAVYINGIWIGQSGSFADPLSRHQNEPLLFRFSSELLHQGHNRINIRLKTSFHQQGFLDHFYFAPVTKVYNAYAVKHFIRVDLIEWLTVATYAMGLILLIFWIMRPQDSIYGLFALQLFFWATHNLNLIVNNIPVSTRIWEAMNISTLGWTVVTMIFFNHRYIGVINKRVEKIMLLFALLGSSLLFLTDLNIIMVFGYRIWDSFVMIFGIYAIYYLLSAYQRNRHPDTYLMLLAGLPILVCGFHDILVINHLYEQRDGLIMQYSALPVAFLFSWFLIRRFVQSLNHSEYLTASLKNQVLEKQQELQTQYDKSVLLEKQQVLAEERARMMRDIHDGIGGQLVIVLSLLQEHHSDIINNIREKIQHSLTDLRIVIDSLDPLLNDLPTLLGVMRMRLFEQLKAADINLEWAITEVPEIINTSPQHGLHIMRIVQEAITNSIKHAGTKEMKIATGVIHQQQQVFIDIIDYGNGMSLETNTGSEQGRGIKNMYYRAQQLGATLAIDSSAKGTRIRLLLTR